MAALGLDRYFLGSCDHHILFSGAAGRQTFCLFSFSFSRDRPLREQAQTPPGQALIGCTRVASCSISISISHRAECRVQTCRDGHFADGFVQPKTSQYSILDSP